MILEDTDFVKVKYLDYRIFKSSLSCYYNVLSLG